MKRKGLMKVSDLTNRINEILNCLVWNVYGKPVDGKVSIMFDLSEFEEEYISRKKFRETIRILIEHEIKRYYNIIP